MKVANDGVKFSDLLLAGAVKYFEERALAGVVGNGTLVSGAVKLAGAYASKKFLGKSAEPITLALGIDAAEDLIMGVMGLFGSGTGSQNSGINVI